MFEYKKTEEDFKYTKKFKDLELKNNLFKTKNKPNQERNKKNSTNYLSIIFALVFVLISSKLYLDHSNILTSHVKGIITNIQKDFYRTNDLDFSRVKNYKISYQFKVNNHIYKNMIIIEQNDFKYYSNLNSNLKVGDSLNIEYDKADLFKNRIKK